MFDGSSCVSATTGSLRGSVFPGRLLLHLIKVALQLFDLVIDLSQAHALRAYQDLVLAFPALVSPAGTLDIHVGDRAMAHCAWRGSQEEQVKRVRGHMFLRSASRDRLGSLLVQKIYPNVPRINCRGQTPEILLHSETHIYS